MCLIRQTSLTSFMLIVLPPPRKLELTLNGKAKEKQSSKEGIYSIADGKTNGYHYWVKEDQKQALWFDKVGSRWKIGSLGNLGSATGGIRGPKGKDSYPHEVKGYTFFDGEDWPVAGPKDVVFKVIGKVHISNEFSGLKLLIKY